MHNCPRQFTILFESCFKARLRHDVFMTHLARYKNQNKQLAESMTRCSSSISYGPTLKPVLLRCIFLFFLGKVNRRTNKRYVIQQRYRSVAMYVFQQRHHSVAMYVIQQRYRSFFIQSHHSHHFFIDFLGEIPL